MFGYVFNTFITKKLEWILFCVLTSKLNEKAISGHLYKLLQSMLDTFTHFFQCWMRQETCTNCTTVLSVATFSKNKLIVIHNHICIGKMLTSKFCIILYILSWLYAKIIGIEEITSSFCFFFISGPQIVPLPPANMSSSPLIESRLKECLSCAKWRGCVICSSKLLVCVSTFWVR